MTERPDHHPEASSGNDPTAGATPPPPDSGRVPTYNPPPRSEQNLAPVSGPPAYAPIPGGAGLNLRPAAPAKSYLLPAVLLTLFCFMPTGIVAIVYALRTNSMAAAGHYEGAAAASGKARLWLIITVVAGLLWGLFFLVPALSNS